MPANCLLLLSCNGKCPKNNAKKNAEASGATADAKIDTKTLVTYNNPELTRQMIPSLQKATNNNAAVMGAEDFSFFAAKVPSMFFYLGGMTPGTDPKKQPHITRPIFMLMKAE